MITKGKSPVKIVTGLLNRSTCNVQVAAILTDSKGRVVATGWNHAGPDGFGEHAEIHCLKRANPDRVGKAVLWVIARRRKSGNPVTAKPCAACTPAVKECLGVVYRHKDGLWYTWDGVMVT